MKGIEWDDKIMFIINSQGSITNHYILLAKGEQLTCCNGDSLKGPMNDIAFKSTVARLELPVELKNKVEY
jgi:hypothetical protein